MAWVKRLYSKGQIDRAGSALLDPPHDPDEFQQYLDVINNWRACHSYPLQAIKMTLLKRAKKVNASALIAQRLKRLPSVTVKLAQNPNMKLSQMQDMGGCRAIMPTIYDVKKIIEVYKISSSKNPRTGRPIQHEVYDYIGCPKLDGYRSYHLIFKYQSNYKEKKEFEGQRIEIQIRSRLQHAWATAVETVQTFTGQALKSKIKAGDPDWLRFFSLMGSAIALRERCALVHGTPPGKDELMQEIRALASKLSVEHVLRGWGIAAETLMKQADEEAAFFLLVLDSSKKTIQINPFKREEQKAASDAYMQVEKRTKDQPEVQTVLVSVESVESLRAAYPNYFLDTNAFLDAMNHAIK